MGTSTSKEGREYFANLEKCSKDFIWEDEQDWEAIELAFSKKKIEERKSWLRQFEVKVLPCFLLVLLEKVTDYISNITPSACAAWYSPFANLEKCSKDFFLCFFFLYFLDLQGWVT